MAHPELIAAMIARVQHAQEGVRTSLLTSIYLILRDHLSTEEEASFEGFYQEMMQGMTTRGREAGAEPKTIDELEAFISEINGVPEHVRKSCVTMIELMRPPDPLNL